MFDYSFVSLLSANFHFIRPMLLLLILPLALIIAVRWQRSNGEQSEQVLPEHLHKALTVGELGWRKRLPLKLLTVLLLLAIVSSAGPTWTRYDSPFNEDKAALLVVVDLSQSMLEKDVAPNRLIRTQHKIIDLIEQRDGGRTGLIAYAGSAHVVMPLTADKQVFTPFVSALSPEIMPIEGKQAQQALPLIDTLLSEQKGASILLITDGMVPTAINAYQDYFSNSPHQLLILGVGDTQREATLPLDVRSLQELANKTDASLRLISVDDQDVQALAKQIARHMEIASDSMMPWQDMGYYLLFPMSLLLLLWFRKGWLVNWSVVLVIAGNSLLMPTPVHASEGALLQQQTMPVEVQQREQKNATLTTTIWQTTQQAWFDLWLTPDQQGDRALHKKQYLQAAQHYQDPFLKGIAYYYAAQFKAAQISFMQQPTPQSLLYAGNALARQREYIAARNLLVDLGKQMDQAPRESDVLLRADVSNNLAAIQKIIDDINRYSESQKGTTDGLEESFELDKEDPITSDGFEEIAPQEVLHKETLNAREILGSEELANKWLNRVEADPTRFLQAKFYLQLQSQFSEDQ
ncbi:transporter [Psychromonas marina]|uniref:Transporter n=1 Tax=Psychromonas marina TaxID=88364 RepID=A0ABQ6E1G4_9GAMM|nr:VWA domain-containing protein [Psychromonas marina]GLS91165.1 transporter [Psychromonas marina]